MKRRNKHVALKLQPMHLSSDNLTRISIKATSAWNMEIRSNRQVPTSEGTHFFQSWVRVIECGRASTRGYDALGKPLDMHPLEGFAKLIFNFISLSKFVTSQAIAQFTYMVAPPCIEGARHKIQNNLFQFQAMTGDLIMVFFLANSTKFFLLYQNFNTLNR